MTRKHLSNRIMATAISAASVMLMAGTASAQPDPSMARRNGDSLVVTAFGQHASLPVPGHIGDAGSDEAGADVSAKVDIYRQQLPGGELVEVLEAGTEKADWRQITGAFVMDRAIMPIDAHRKIVGGAFNENCAEGRLFFEAIDPFQEGGLPLALLVCEVLKTRAADTDSPTGEIMAVALVKTDDVTARIYVDWRGPAFVANDVRTWPVGDINDFQATMERLSAAAGVTSPGDK